MLNKRKNNLKSGKCINLFNVSPDVFNQTFSEKSLKALKAQVEYWRPEGELERLIRNDYFFRELLQEAEILITGSGTPELPFDLLSKGNLRYICHVTGSIRKCISKRFLGKGILVSNWGNSISHSIAEAALMLILACLRRLGMIRRQLEAGYWTYQQRLPLSLYNQRIGLLGFGAVAQDLVRLLAPFKVHIQAFDPYVSNEPFQRLKVQRMDNLEELFKQNDIISLHAGMTEELDGIVNQKLLALLPDDGVLINTARGGLVNEADLLVELQKGRLWCGLDVFVDEPLSIDSPFRYHPRCIITPHSAGPTINCFHDMGNFAVKNILHYLRGEPLQGQITLEQYDRIT